jgi:hypothetical protein
MSEAGAGVGESSVVEATPDLVEADDEPRHFADDELAPAEPRAGWRRLVPNDTEGWIGLATVTACVVFVLAQIHPDLIIANTTPAGGDMGAHVWGPAYLRDHLLPSFRLTGWTPDWYAGFPAFQFYMLPPALLILLFDIVLPYGIAMKIVTVLGVVVLPICAYAMGKLARLPFPGPPMLAVAMVPFLFDRGTSPSAEWKIYGGNIPSTLAGEYSFSISLALALLFFGYLARGLETGKHRGLATVLLALSILCHAIPAFFALVGGVVLVLMRLDRARVLYAAPILVLGSLMTAFWSLPFVLRRGYLTDMGWEKLDKYQAHLLQHDQRWVFVLAIVGLVMSLVFRIRFGVFVGILAVLFAIAFRLDAAAPVHIWNARLLPFYYLCLYLLAGIGASEIMRSIAELIGASDKRRRRSVEATGTLVLVGMALVIVALPMRTLPGGKTNTDNTYEWLGLKTRDDSYIDSWAAWNYEGYERKAAYPEYRNIVTTMKDLGKTHGCGRAHWEYQEGTINAYGTPMALMLLPFWTDGCIGSMEGLYFESSGSTPFHFLNAAEVSAAPSNPVRDIPARPISYSGFDLDRGIKHLKLYGVRYYMAFSTQAVTAADASPDLVKVAASAPWSVYEIKDSTLVEPLRYEPAVVKGLSTANPAWQKEAIAWYSDMNDLDLPLAADGPKQWQRITEGATPARRALPATKVTNIHQGDFTMSFDVDEVGRPMLVKTSYFPNWKVSGAKGPYHVTPNLMVVIPTSTHVAMRYGYTGVDYLGWLLTLLSIAGVVWLVRRGPVVFPVKPVPDAPRRGIDDLSPAPPPPFGDTWVPDDGDGELLQIPDDEGDDEPVPVGADVWADVVEPRSAGAQGSPQLDEAYQRAGDPAHDRGPRGTSLLDPHGELGDDDASPLGT